MTHSNLTNCSARGGASTFKYRKGGKAKSDFRQRANSFKQNNQGLIRLLVHVDVAHFVVVVDVDVDVDVSCINDARHANNE